MARGADVCHDSVARSARATVALCSPPNATSPFIFLPPLDPLISSPSFSAFAVRFVFLGSGFSSPSS
jgi:hypothetical protein